MSRLSGPATRLAIGSRALSRKIITKVGGWVARGRRHDLTGWRAALGCWARLAALTLGLYLLWRLIRAVPSLLLLLNAAWILTAWRAGKPTPEAQDGASASAPDEVSTEAVRDLLLELMGDASAVHLRTVLAHLQEHGQWEGRTVADLRARLETLGIPVHPKVKAAGAGPTRGVRRIDLAPSPVESQEPSTEPSTAA